MGSIAVETLVSELAANQEEERDILFGQRRAGPTLSTKDPVDADLRGRELKSVAAELSSGARRGLTLMIWDKDGTLISLNTRGRAIYALARKRPSYSNLILATPSPSQIDRLTATTDYDESLPARRITITPTRTSRVCLYGVSIDSGEITCP